MKTNQILIAILLGFGLIFAGCIKKDDYDFGDRKPDLEWNPVLGLPLVDSKLTLREIIRDSKHQRLIVIDSKTGLLSLQYTSNLYNATAQSLIFDKITTLPVSPIPTANMTDLPAYPVGVAYPVITGNSNVPISSPEISGWQMDKIIFKGGSLNIGMNNSNMQHSTLIKVTLPSLHKNGISFSGLLHYNDTAQTYSAVRQDLNGYTFNISHPQPYQNEFPVALTYTLYGDNTPVTSNEYINLSLAFDSCKYQRIEGYFGQPAISLNEDTLPIDLFQNKTGGNAVFTEPKLLLKVTNTFGMPLDIRFRTMNVFSPATNQSGYVAYNVNYQDSVLLIPAYANNGDSIIKRTIDNTNSNINNVFTNISPSFITWAIAGQPNPAGYIPAQPNFVDDNSRFRLDDTLILPLKGYTDGFILRDTIEFSYPGEIKEVEYVKYRTYFENSFPMRADFQAVVCDSNYLKIDSLYDVNDGGLAQYGLQTYIPKISIAQMNHPSYPPPKPYQTTVTQQDTYMSNARWQKMKDAKYIILITKLRTEPNPKVYELYADFSMHVKMGIMVKGKASASSY